MARLVRLGEANIGVWGGQSVAPRLADHLLLSGKGYRGKGVAAVALEGAIEQIKKLGGGRMEGYPEDTEGRNASPAFLFNRSLSTFERLGFERSRLIGKHKWVVIRSVR
jgi:GNAT superfamily N-acetyltransferase